MAGNLPKRQVNRGVVFGSTRDLTIASAISLSPPEKYSEQFEKDSQEIHDESTA